jgi:hypothetical protein
MSWAPTEEEFKERVAAYNAENGSKRRASDAKATHWLDECIKGETGKPLPILANVLIALPREWPDAFAYDEMLCAPVLMRALDGTNDFIPHPITDVDVIAVQISYSILA